MNTRSSHFAMPGLLALAACGPIADAPERADAEIIVCADESESAGCDHVGIAGLQAAIDAAAPGATLRIRPGLYTPQAHRDVPFQDLAVRGAVVIDDKQVALLADTGAIIQGDPAYPVSAMVVRNSEVRISGLEVSGFHYKEPEDDVYDGHGIFTINSQVMLDGVEIRGVAKMAVTGRENGHITANGLSITNSHLGVWLEEFAVIDLKDSRIIGSESAAIAAYGDATANVTDSVIDGNEDDGLYTEDRARIVSRRTAILSNSPYGARAAGNSEILICGGKLLDNAEAVGVEDNGSVLHDDEEACGL